MLQQMLIADMGPELCAERKPEWGALRDCWPTAELRVRVVHGMPKPGPAVTLMLVRTPHPIPDGFAVSVRGTCRARFLIGLLCTHGSTELVAGLDGFDDFLFCPFSEVELQARVRRLVGPAQPEHSGCMEFRKLQLDALVGESPAFLRVLEKIPTLTGCNASVLISGDTGTGKELLARAVHYNGSRRGKPFVPVNCGALPDTLFENELFGHARGAYTDAGTAEKGLLAAAHGGTLFLDEVDTLSAAAQIKLLRFLQDREYRPLGSHRTETADVRILAATNADLRERVQRGLLRDDLYHRLNILSVHMPALRERIEDLPLLAAHIVSHYARQHGRQAPRISPGALQALMAYRWPGNIRELEAVIQRAILFASRPVLDAGDFDLPDASDHVLAETARSFFEEKRRAIGAFERAYVSKVLAEHAGNMSHAAKAAGKDRRAFQRLVRKYRLERTGIPSAAN